MRRLASTVALVAILAVSTAPAAGAVVVSAVPTALSTRLGETVAFTTTIANDDGAAEGPLVAHLNILSLRPGVYVDPEDWSTTRTRYLAALPPGGSTTVRWEVKAVNSGAFSAYVATIQPGSARPPITSPAVTISVAGRRTLNSGGILPLAIGIPVLLAAATGAVRLRRRRH